DVFAYSNEREGRRTLVLVNNRFAEVDIRVDRSVAAATRDAAGHKRRTSTRLARALAASGDDATEWRFHDARTGREQRVTAAELRDRGLGLHLGPYEAIVFDVGPAPRAPEPAPAVTPPQAAASASTEPTRAVKRRATPKCPASKRASAKPQSRKSTRRSRGSGSEP
ncbi:MAG TPA: hypothetical protein VF484_01520, partial [Candidatus Limnocylindrales bacterium]